MEKKVLIADDLMSINLGVNTLLEEIGIKTIVYTPYCDEALLKIKRAYMDNEPFDMLITDLSFKQDHRMQTLKGGEDLVASVRKIMPDLKIIVYSVENKVQCIKRLMEDYKVDGYVCKGRYGLEQLKRAVLKVYQGETYLCPELESNILNSKLGSIDDFDILLLEQLAEGFSQDQISENLKKQKIKPNSLSSIEKRLNRLKIQFHAKNTTHLVAITKDMGLI